MPDTVTEGEIRAGAEAEEREAREQYAGRMAKRWNHRAEYSLDPSNRRAAETRAAEWEKVANAGDGGIINSKLTDRFIDIWNESDDIFDFVEIEHNIEFSSVGQMASKYIQDNGMSIFPEGDLYGFY